MPAFLNLPIRSVVVVGDGHGIGLSVARRFHKEGYAVAVIARTSGTVTGVVTKLKAMTRPENVIGLVADVTDEQSLFEALDTAKLANGVPDVLIYDTGVIRTDRVGDLSADELLSTYAVNVVGAAVTAGHVAPLMARRGRGTILITGGMAEPKADWFSLSLGKYGVRTLVELLAEEFEPQGLHVATVAVTEVVAPGTSFDPDTIAETYMMLHQQEKDWKHEVVFTPKIGPRNKAHPTSAESGCRQTFPSTPDARS